MFDDIFIEPEKTTLLDNISLITYLKKGAEIVRNGGLFYAVYDCVMSKNGKVYENIIDVIYEEEKCPKVELNELGVGKKIVFKELDISYMRGIIRYLSYHPDSLRASYYANSMIDCSPENVFLVLEKLLPKKKLYIKNIGQKGKELDDKEFVERVREFYHVSTRRAKDYITTISKVGKIEEFSTWFEGGEFDKKKATNKTKKKDVVRTVPVIDF